jgi:hypothetical protein
MDAKLFFVYIFRWVLDLDPDPTVLDLHKIPDPVPDPTLNIHSFKSSTILKDLSWLLKPTGTIQIRSRIHNLEFRIRKKDADPDLQRWQ